MNLVKLKYWSTKKLLDEYEAQNELINKIGCYGVDDIKLFLRLGELLDGRESK